ncbi:MAG: sigma factor-like helix-turn-helix DNA-binding protein [Patescibacteria group bacterium]|nr:sigma factor-like helix-turn-helix DNA-binding protein [Patescibacteria group bacterium]
MENLLENIVLERRTEELNKLNAIQIVNSIFSDLMERERDILTRRFGLDGNKNETLEKIGQMHKLTRERVRQIENASIKKIKRLESLSDSLSTLKGVVSHLLKEHGGLLRRDFLLDILSVMILENDGKADIGDPEYQKNLLIHKNRFNFLLSKLLVDDFDVIGNSENFNNSIKLKDESVEHFEALSKGLLTSLENLNQTLSTDELMDLVRNLEAYKTHQDRIENDGDANITSVFESDLFHDKGAVINKNKSLYSLMQAIKDLEQNKFGYWGKANWQEIKPKTINDKIYLVLKNFGKPLHFTDIASKINDVKFDQKVANPATVHNELILDNRYILTGRGMYGLKDWNNA